jgi:hypothetical protein
MTIVRPEKSLLAKKALREEITGRVFMDTKVDNNDKNVREIGVHPPGGGPA